jgi:hypothetical protein
MKFFMTILAIVFVTTAVPAFDHVGPSVGYSGWACFPEVDISKPMLPVETFRADAVFDPDGKTVVKTQNDDDIRLNCQFWTLLGDRACNDSTSDCKVMGDYTVFLDYKPNPKQQLLVYKGNKLTKIVTADINWFDMGKKLFVWKHYLLVSGQRRKKNYQEYFVIYIVDLEGSDTWEFTMNKDPYNPGDRDYTIHKSFCLHDSIVVASGAVIDLASMKLLWNLEENENFLGFDGDNCVTMNYYEKHEEGKQFYEMHHYELVTRKLAYGKEIKRKEFFDKMPRMTRNFMGGTCIGVYPKYDKIGENITTNNIFFLVNADNMEPYFTLDAQNWDIDYEVSSDGRLVFVSQWNRKLCIEMKTGKVLWSKSVPQITAFQSRDGHIYVNWESTDENGKTGRTCLIMIR